jgi:hypothetical protein
MNLTKRAFAALVLFAATFAKPLLAQEIPTNAKKYAPMPWHLVDTWWDIGKEQVFESLAVDVTISDDVPASVNLYIAPIGLGHLDKTPFYGGIQTQSDGNTRSDPKLRRIGPGLLFSMWNERKVEAIRPAMGGYFQSSGHEGDFVSARRPYQWTKGKYTYRLCRMDREVVDGEARTWVGAFVYSHGKDENIFVGALRFKGEKLLLQRKVANFVEIYGAARPVADIPKLAITFGSPVVNGVLVKGATAEAVYPLGVPDVAETEVKDGGLLITLGEERAVRPKRRVKLLVEP